MDDMFSGDDEMASYQCDTDVDHDKDDDDEEVRRYRCFVSSFA